MAGVPSNPNEPVNTMCSQNGGTVCNGSGACKKANGAVCAAATECLSTFCVDGVCCNTTCSGTCKSCNVAGSVGTCANVPSASDDAPGCTGANSCDGAGNCKKDNAQGCAGSSECVSAFCVDGYCCANACTATCKSCGVAGSLGVCSNIPSGSDDANGVPACSGANQSCDGAGTCKKENGQTCTMAADCLSGNCFDGYCCNTACNGTCKACNVTGSLGTCTNTPSGQDDVGTCSGSTQSCDGTGTCKSENGQACAINSQCLSSICVDSVCCNSLCSGLCQACSSAKTGGMNGICGPVFVGTDPDNECLDMGAATCGANGFCNGMSACQLYAAGTTCAAQSCSNGIQSNADTCNGGGTCIDGGTASCSPYVCGATACKTSCASDVDCMSGFYCSSTSCVSLKPSGQVCTAANECLSGFCTDGVCCTTACTGTCLACDIVGMVGQCANLPLGTDDNNPAMACTGTLTCDGAGSCKKKSGELCTMDSECASNNCLNGSNTCQ